MADTFKRQGVYFRFFGAMSVKEICTSGPSPSHVTTIQTTGTCMAASQDHGPGQAYAAIQSCYYCSDQVLATKENGT